MLARSQSQHLSTSATAGAKLLTASASSCGCSCGCMRPWHSHKDSSDCCAPLLSSPRFITMPQHTALCGLRHMPPVTCHLSHANTDTRTHPLNAASPTTNITLRLTTPTSRCAFLTLLDLPTARHSSNSHQSPSASSPQHATGRHSTSHASPKSVASKCLQLVNETVYVSLYGMAVNRWLPAAGSASPRHHCPDESVMCVSCHTSRSHHASSMVAAGTNAITDQHSATQKA